MTIVTRIVDAFVDGSTPPDNCTYSLNFLVSDGTYSSNAMINSNVLQSLDQIKQDLSEQVAVIVNQALSLTLTAADVRILN